MTSASIEQVREELLRLGPWHVDIDVRPGLSTRAFLDSTPASESADFAGMAFVDSRAGFQQAFTKLYPAGLEGRSALDCACNCGAYLLWLRELGAGRCLGFDVREHWIKQARFLARERRAAEVSFEVFDLYELPKLGLDRFDVTLFNGIFYHLPDPVTGLKIAAELTNELLVVNTAVKRGYPPGVLVASQESTTHGLSGVYGLHWWPSGPRVVSEILRWLGFAHTRCDWWSAVPDQQEPGLDRMLMFASRDPGVFEHYDRAKGSRWREVMRNTIPPETTVLVAGHSGGEAGEGDPPRLHGRHSLSFPDRARVPETASPEALIAELERLRSKGAAYLLIPGEDGRAWLERHPGLEGELEARYHVAARDEACLIFELRVG